MRPVLTSRNIGLLLKCNCCTVVNNSFFLERTEMGILRWMMEIKRIKKIRNEDITAREGVANISEKIREARLRWLGHVERKTEEDVVMRTWKMEVG